MTQAYFLDDGVARNKEYPNTFYVPTEEEKAKVKVGDFVKVIFRSHDGGPAERMWLQITEPGKGTLDNDPVIFRDVLKHRDVVEFKPENIIDILTPEDFK